MITREQAHAKVDEVFDELDRMTEEATYPYALERIMLQQQRDGSIEGCVLVNRTGITNWGPYVTWGISPHASGLHSGHYDMHQASASHDWLKRVERGW